MSAALVPLLALAAVPGSASAQVAAPALEAELRGAADQPLTRFYAARGFRPIWVKDGAVVPDALRLVEVIRDGEVDGLASSEALAAKLDRAIAEAAWGDGRDLARAELILSRALVDYVQTLRRPVNVGMVYADQAVAPATPSVPAILGAAAAAPSLERHLATLPDINPIYARLREALLAARNRRLGWVAASLGGSDEDPAEVERRLMINLDRARALPAERTGRYILVDAASQRLWLYEDGKVRDSMKVIVGKATEPTPMIAGVIRTAVLNPYWNVPPDLVRKRVAAKVLEQGVGYLRESRYEVLSDWSDNARPIDPDEVDWQAVAAGEKELRVRQLPGAGNAMGAVKFPFPNPFGVYLHDTPEKHLFAQADRNLSSGCVRLEDAGRLAKWLFGKAPRAPSSRPEQAVELPEPVPVYITYLTADWDGAELAFRRDPYLRDLPGSGRAAGRQAAAD
ncbi:MAG TPA: L,D-transpeptidase family protein [Allosphingosinicella sp.]|nr:L,D-transpeptidase family protein [Allosphingosinicella sp.]